MHSSTFSSETAHFDSAGAWRRFFRLTLGVAAGVAALVYGFIVIVDPFDILPLSPSLARAPISTNARFSFPALARAPRFDSAILGTSTSRLLRPAVLDPAFDARFVNLAMNAATAYEQTRMLDLFARNHPDAKFLILGLDIAWCGTGELQKYTPRPFPEWMYGDDRWRGYPEMFNLYALTEAVQQFAHLTRLKRSRYGADGYTSFVPDDRSYDRVRVAEHLRRDAAEIGGGEIAGSPATWRFPAIDLLQAALTGLPPGTRKLLYFAPYNHVLQPTDGPLAQVWAACKRHVATAAARVPNAIVADFMIPSPITRNDDNYWDALHYRIGIGDRLARDLAAAARGEPSAAGDYALLPAPITVERASMRACPRGLRWGLR
jgi:hypothetical protein